jgi:glucans biosynthesis protein
MRSPSRFSRLGWITLGSLLVASAPGTAAAFGLEDVARRAKQLSLAAYADPRGGVPPWLLDLNYDQYRDIRFRPERALWGNRKLPFSVQFFHAGFLYDRAVSLHVVSRSGAVSPIAFSPDQFDYGRNEFESRVPQDLGYAGFRIHHPIKSGSYYDEVAAFLGASYFRAVGRDQVYGLSARGVAIDTALSSGEEFPWFREFWLVQPAPGAKALTLYALLDSPSAAGAYRFEVTPGAQTRIDVELMLFPRRDLGKLGIAPLTSMFLHGEGGGGELADYRPEVHDSDGLLLAAASGEWLWRPLQNPENLSVTSFELVSPRGFGLVQRDREFDHYQDIEARPDLRPSAWIEPEGEWGAGRIELVEIPTRNDTNNNIVAYWVPRAPAIANTPVSFAYSVLWYGDDRERPAGGRSVATRRDAGTHPDARRLVVDFEGEALRRLPPEAVVEGRVTTIPATGSGAGLAQPAELLEQQVIRNPVTGGSRLVLQLKPPDDGPVELRAFLRHGANAITETWSYLLVP